MTIDAPRNAACPCGSGAKFKKCCATIATTAERRAGLVIAMPMRDNPTPETARALKENTPPHRLLTVAGLPVDEARNNLVRQVLALDPKPEAVVFVDSDGFWFPQAIPSLLDVFARYTDVGVATGFYGFRQPFAPPNALKNGDGNSFIRLGEDCQPGAVVPIASAGFQMVAVRRSVLERIGPNPFSVADVPNGEDVAFFIRCNRFGIGAACHTGVPVVHVGDDGCGYLPGTPRFAIRGNGLIPMSTPTPDSSSARRRTRDYGPAVNARLDAAAAALARVAASLRT